jgi:hypothetical protein
MYVPHIITSTRFFFFCVFGLEGVAESLSFLQDPVKVKLERHAKSVSDDNRRGADEDTGDIRAQHAKVGEEDADGLGETESARVSGTESESVEDAGIGGKRKRRPSSAATHRNGENTGGEERDSSRIERNKRLHTVKDDSESSRG